MSVAEKSEPQILNLPASMQSVPMTPMTMLNMAVSKGATIEVLEKLMALSERWEAGQARKAFDEAVAEAKAEIKPVVRNATGHNAKKYADFAAIASAVDPIISKHGLSYRFRTAQTDKIAVTCILSHKSGHYEETTLCGPADATGNKNAIQAIGSTLTYLQRYSLVQALGLAASNDDDGKAMGVAENGGFVTDEQVAAINKLIADTGTNLARFCGYMKVETIADIPVKQYQRAIDALNAKKGQS